MKKDVIVVKQNILVNARYKLSPLESKVVLKVVSLVSRDDSDFWTYSIPIKELGADYKTIKGLCPSLMKKVFEVKEPDGWIMMSWFSSIRYKGKQGLIEFSFDPNLKPYLLHLKENFTAYSLECILPMRSSYSIRLYELLKQYKKIGHRTFVISELQDMLQVPKSYSVWRDFKKRVLDIAKKEIKEHTDIEIDWGTIRTGRKITSIRFTISLNSKLKGLSDYVSRIRANQSNSLLMVFKDSETDKEVSLSVASDGVLYDLSDPYFAISARKALILWEYMYENDLNGGSMSYMS